MEYEDALLEKADYYDPSYRDKHTIAGENSDGPTSSLANMVYQVYPELGSNQDLKETSSQHVLDVRHKDDPESPGWEISALCISGRISSLDNPVKTLCHFNITQLNLRLHVRGLHPETHSHHFYYNQHIHQTGDAPWQLEHPGHKMVQELLDIVLCDDVFAAHLRKMTVCLCQPLWTIPCIPLLAGHIAARCPKLVSLHLEDMQCKECRGDLDALLGSWPSDTGSPPRLIMDPVLVALRGSPDIRPEDVTDEADFDRDSSDDGMSSCLEYSDSKSEIDAPQREAKATMCIVSIHTTMCNRH